jgi:hypothetical protein
MERITPPESPGLAGPLNAVSDLLPLLVLIGLAAFFAFLAFWWLPRHKKSAKSRRMFRVVPKLYRAHFDRPIPVQSPALNMSDPVRQLEAVHQSGFERTRLLNKEEARLLPILEAAVSAIGHGHRIMAQTRVR